MALHHPSELPAERSLVTLGSRPEIREFSPAQVDLIKRTIAKDCSNDELALFLEVCRSSGLDPFRRQIYAIKRGGQMTIQTGIDGYRLLAARTGDLAGIDDPVYDTGDNNDAEHPNWARVTVWRWSHGQRVSYSATARWREYQQSGGNWGKMPYLMLGKCAEALALRRAFPAELSGVYTADEMAQADRGDEVAPLPYVEADHSQNQAQSDERIDKALRDREVLDLLTTLGHVEQRARRAHLATIFERFDANHRAVTPRDLKAALEAEIARARQDAAQGGQPS